MKPATSNCGPISIHSPHTGRDIPPARRCPFCRNFNPLSPHGERPGVPAYAAIRDAFQSTLPTRGETPLLHQFRVAFLISIHSPHTGRDGYPPDGCPVQGYFNPLSPHGERQPTKINRRVTCQFQSTLPTRGETKRNYKVGNNQPNFNPLSPHGERQWPQLLHLCHNKFQSTLPTRGETANAYNLSARKVVASAQHRLIFDSSLLFPAVQNWFLG